MTYQTVECDKCGIRVKVEDVMAGWQTFHVAIPIPRNVDICAKCHSSALQQFWVTPPELQVRP